MSFGPKDVLESEARRLFLGGLAGACAVAALAPRQLLAGAQDERILSFVHTHTHERLTVPYFAGGEYIKEGLARLKAFLRDHRTGDEHEMDASLFDLLNDLRLATGTRSPFYVISGYRSQRTNTMLREHGSGVSRGSLHLQGRAIDIRLSDFATAKLRDAAIELGRGGVGYYKISDFVHVDTGRVRRW